MSGIGSALLSGYKTYQGQLPPTSNPWGGPGGGGGSLTGNSIGSFGGANALGNLSISGTMPFSNGSLG
jgi:hypothetical protein